MKQTYARLSLGAGFTLCLSGGIRMGCKGLPYCVETPAALQEAAPEPPPPPTGGPGVARAPVDRRETLLLDSR